MQPNPEFISMPKHFWADVRTLSQKIGYQRKGEFIVPTEDQVVTAYRELALDPSHLVERGKWTEYGRQVRDYLAYRGQVLTEKVQHYLMNADEARALFEETCERMPARLSPQPMNKQKGAMKAPAYLTCLVNMSVESAIGDLPCDYDPRELTAITRDGRPVRTLARRVDGAFPSATNPLALWEIKEYYYTTTFGSRVADGVYESLLDGMELEELKENEGIDVEHYLIIDAHGTWWEMGKSYLCRMIDMMHQGYVTEVLFGSEVVERLPEIAAGWVDRIPEAVEREAGTQTRLL
jgi:hypothetical protein